MSWLFPNLQQLEDLGKQAAYNIDDIKRTVGLLQNSIGQLQVELLGVRAELATLKDKVNPVPQPVVPPKA